MPARFAHAALVLTLAACTTAPASPAADEPRVADGASVTLAPGDSAQLADSSRIQYLELVSDSRCPPDVQCVWAGDAVIAMRLIPAAGAAQDFELHTMPKQRAFVFGRRTITLQSLERGDAPKATLQVDAKH